MPELDQLWMALLLSAAAWEADASIYKGERRTWRLERAATLRARAAELAS